MMVIRFNSMTHINNLKLLDKFLSYMACDGDIFYRREHGEIYDTAFKGYKNVSNCLYRLKNLGYVKNVPHTGVWFMTKAGIEYLNKLWHDMNVDSTSVYLPRNNELHQTAKNIVDRFLDAQCQTNNNINEPTSQETDSIANSSIAKCLKYVYDEIRLMRSHNFLPTREWIDTMYKDIGNVLIDNKINVE